MYRNEKSLEKKRWRNKRGGVKCIKEWCEVDWNVKCEVGVGVRWGVR